MSSPVSSMREEGSKRGVGRNGEQEGSVGMKGTKMIKVEHENTSLNPCSYFHFFLFCELCFY